jgi:hypothetical protein
MSYSSTLAPDLQKVGAFKFRGDFRGYDQNTWAGDEVIVENTEGMVRIMYDDEQSFAASITSWFSRMWSKPKSPTQST